MSGKYQNKKPKNKTRKILLIVLVLCIALLAAVLFWTHSDAPQDNTAPVASNGTSGDAAIADNGENETKPVQVEELEEVSIDLGNGLRIVDVGKYTGVYMEDGSDEIVSGVMMIAVVNEGDDAIQYAEITMPVGSETASFSLTTLLPGSKVILLELNRMAYKPGTYQEAAASNVALFQTPVSLCENLLETQILDGAINVSNISGEDISGDIVIYYKNRAADVYYGGITYRVRMEGGMKEDEIRQIMASHFSESGSEIVFITCGVS